MKNWFIEVGAGAQLPFVEDTRFKGDWSHQITAIYNLGFGHWWSPYFGFRMNATYGAIHWDSEGWGKAQNVSLNAEIDVGYAQQHQRLQQDPRILDHSLRRFRR